MQSREIIPLKQGIDFELTLPGSKSITNRALLCATLAKGKSRLSGPLFSDDTRVMMKALAKLGAKIRKTGKFIEVIGTGGNLKSGRLKLDLENSGTAVRFLTAIAAIRRGETVITGSARMRERPIGDLTDGLRQVGAKIEYLEKKGCPPVKILNFKLQITNYKKFIIKIKGDKSSQYVSALLMLGPLLNKPMKIEIIGELASKPYIDVTVSVLKAFGIKIKNKNYKSFEIKPQRYKAADYRIEGDASAASYWTSIAYLNGGKVKFTNLNKKSVQGDIRYADALKKLESMSAVDMSAMPDSAMTLAVTTPFFKKRTKITGLSTLRLKETDRLAALHRELNKIGVQSAITKDSISIGSSIGTSIGSSIGSSIGTYSDHRMAMCFAVIGTKIPGIVIENPGCVSKTYPAFWDDFEQMYLSKKIRLGKKNLVLTGMRCSGKTFLGKKIARILGRKFIDLDAGIEEDQKMPVREIVKKSGWEHFRKIEHKICSKYSETGNLVISTGGGVILDERNMRSLKKNGIVLFIFADPSVLAARMAKESALRPSLTGQNPADEIKKVWQDRRDLYLKYADFVWDNTGGKVISESLGQIFA